MCVCSRRDGDEISVADIRPSQEDMRINKTYAHLINTADMGKGSRHDAVVAEADHCVAMLRECAAMADFFENGYHPQPEHDQD